jgi:TRAP-type uncharacterized transport system fused permease subunit
MKRTGFRPYEAAAIESWPRSAAPSCAADGAGVFLMAAFTGIPLVEILMYSTAPALIYYIALYAYIDILARKKGLSGLPRAELPQLLEVAKQGWFIMVPIVALIWLLLIGYTRSTPAPPAWSSSSSSAS